MKWITTELKKEIREVFEPRFKRQISNDEVINIANNLANVMEIILKFQWRKNKCQNHLSD